MIFTRRTERASGNDGNVRRFEKTICKRLAVQPERGDAREDVERAHGRKRVETHVRERVQNEPTSNIIFRFHFAYHGKTVFQFVFHNGKRGVLRASGRAHDGILMDLVHGVRYFRRSQYVAESPTRHGKRFAETVDDDAPFFQGGGGDGIMSLFVVCKFAVYFIADDEQVVFNDDLFYF